MAFSSPINVEDSLTKTILVIIKEFRNKSHPQGSSKRSHDHFLFTLDVFYWHFKGKLHDALCVRHSFSFCFLERNISSFAFCPSLLDESTSHWWVGKIGKSPKAWVPKDILVVYSHLLLKMVIAESSLPTTRASHQAS